MKASARKSYGEYKPVIVHPSGRTEIVGRNDRYCPHTGRTFSKRGITFASRADAETYAQNRIDRLNEFAARRKAEYEARHTAL